MSTTQVILVSLVALLAFAILAGVGVAILHYLIGPPAIRTLVHKYLFKLRLAWVSLLAVALCVALVLVVFSVMGGWLAQYRNSFKLLSGDLIISTPRQSGISNYDAIIKRLRETPGVDAAVPVIRTAALINIDNKIESYVQVLGIPIADIDRVWQFGPTLVYNSEVDYPEPWKLNRLSFDLYPHAPYEFILPDDARVRERPGMIVGGLVVGARKKRDGQVDWPPQLELRFARLTVVPAADDLSSATTLNPALTQYWIVHGSRTQLPVHDNNVYVPFDVLQRDLQMNSYTYKDRKTGESKTEPARTSEIHISVSSGIDPIALKSSIEEVVFDTTGQIPNAGFGAIRVQTWQEQQRLWIGAIENEISLVMFLFSFISLVAVALIFCIFYMIVIEKTRDIGILKSVGASPWTVAYIFLCYGAVIGCVGGLLGIALGWTFTHYINPIHKWVAANTGFDPWNPDVYAFDEVPNRVDVSAAGIIFAVAIAAAVVGAGVPALRAAMLRPVRALRFE